MKKAILLPLFAWLFVCGSAFAQQVGYVSDKLTVFVHAGPGTNYRIIGTLEAGERVKVQAQDQEAGFTRIEGTAGRESWVKTEYLMPETSLQMRLPKLEEKLKSLEMQLQQRDQELQNVQSQMDAEQSENSTLAQKLKELETQNQSLAYELETHDESTYMEWFIKGALVLAAGIFFGILIPFFPRRKKRDQGWM